MVSSIPRDQWPSTLAASAGVDGIMFCSACSFSNPPGFKFCGQCGSPLETKPETARALPELAGGPSRATAEHRQLTVLFCDLVDSTALSGSLDLEELREIILEYQAVAGAVIERFGGYIARYLGDGLLVYFGHPRPREDDAHTAVRSALGILDAVRAMSQRLESRGGSSIAVRLSVHTGLVVATEVGTGAQREHFALGETPNIAARLQSVARPNTVVVSAMTRTLTRDYFRFEDLGSHPLKGLTKPVEAFQVLAARNPEAGSPKARDPKARDPASPTLAESAANPTPRAPHLRHDAPYASVHPAVETMAGRVGAGDVAPPRFGQRLALMTDLLRKVREGDGQSVLLLGDSGSARARFVAAVRDDLVASSGHWLLGSCSAEHRHSPLAPITNLLGSLARWRARDTADQRRSKVERAFAELGLAQPRQRSRLVVPLAAAGGDMPPALPTEQGRASLLESFLNLFQDLSALRPLVLVLEDLQWADPLTETWLSLLSPQVPTSRILVILTATAGFRPPPQWPASTRITLSEAE